MFFKQIKHRGDNFSYVIADDSTKEAAIVDPSFNTEAIAQVIKAQGLNAEYIINTHQHTDHSAGNEDLKQRFHAKIVAYKQSNVKKDISVDGGDTIHLGKVSIRVIHTPGHTPDSICLLADGKLLTGDTLFVGECGRTDLPGGNPADMYRSLFDKLIKLDDDVEVYPGHDYGPNPKSTIGKEKETNYTLVERPLEEFVEFMRTS
jgi:glyoxylase-like metal-dependent hydrolase (beta-lactamase superfamily II)